MANFDQNVTINLSVDSKGVQSKLTAAAAQIEGVQESVEGLDTDLDSAGDSLVSFADAARRVDDTDLKESLDTSNIQGEVETFDRFASSLEKVAELKNDVADSNEVLNQRNQETSESTQAEAKSFETLIGNASSLKDAKDAVTNSNEVLDEQNDRTRRSILLEGLAMTEAGEKVDDLDSALDTLLGSQKDLEEQSSVTTKSIAGEHGAARELADGMDGLEGAKRAAANANQKLGADGEEDGHQPAHQSKGHRAHGADTVVDAAEDPGTEGGGQVDHQDQGNGLVLGKAHDLLGIDRRQGHYGLDAAIEDTQAEQEAG